MMWEPVIPKEVSDWMDRKGWGLHHKLWHFSRLWDANPGMNQWVLDHGGSRARRQEGDLGNGLDFLAMHRNMIRTLRLYFPKYQALWHGWNEVPTDGNNPVDPIDQMPGPGPHAAFDPNKLKTLHRLKVGLQDFQDDDTLGRYIETSRRPVPGNPKHISADPTAGIHNYLHARFSVDVFAGCDPDQGVSMANFFGNLKNQRFWRLHGWIDQVWQSFRDLKGSGEDDPSYQVALKEQAVPLEDMPEMCRRETSVTQEFDFFAEDLRDLEGSRL
jgi:hypothetical protein